MTGTSLTARSIVQHLGAVDVGQAEVEEHDVGPVVDDRLQPGQAGRLPVDGVAALA